MASLNCIDLDTLLAPISDDMPTGKDCRHNPSPTSLYQQIKIARNAAREIERKNATGLELGNPDDDWRKVIDIAPKILTNESKDLEVASWYTEALFRRYGFRGLRDGINLLDQLIALFWDQLYPEPDEDGLETKVAPITGFNGTGKEGVLISAIRNTRITQGSSVGPFMYWECQKALSVHSIIDEDVQEKEFKKLGFSFENVEKAINESSTEFLKDLRDDIASCLELYSQMSKRLDELCGTYDSPPTSLVISALDECLRVTKHLTQHRFPEAEISNSSSDEGNSAVSNPAAADQGASSTAPKPQPMAAGPIATREDAFKQLLEIAEFFRKREPHSPVSYVIEKAVKWGKMPLHELMQELITDGNSLKEYGKLTGVNTEVDSE